jgi:uncharacterized membrane protein (DUF106 family)
MIEDTYAFLLVISASIIMSLIITLVYKFTTNQKEMKHIKTEMKRLQKEMKGARNDQKKMLEINNQLMKYNSQYMMKSLRSSLFTMLPAILVFVFLSGHVAFSPIGPGDDFGLAIRHANGVDPNMTELELPPGFSVVNRTVDDNFARFRIQAGEPGEYVIGIVNGDDRVGKDIIVTDNREYARAEEKYPNGRINSARIEYESLTIVRIPFWPREMNWLWLYIIFAILTGTITRKVLNVY